MIATPTSLKLIPRPIEATLGSDSLSIAQPMAISYPDAFAFEGEALRELLSKAGAKLSAGKGGNVTVSLVQDRDELGKLGPEGYSLKIDKAGIEIHAATAAGAYYAVQSIRQMLPVSVETGDNTNFAELPHVKIVDRPKFKWRGMMFDVSRHFFSVDEIKGLLDLLALHKMNIFHWHLVDDGGWRIEIKAYPELTAKGAWRTKKDFVWDYLDIEFPGPGTDKPIYGGFYTQTEVVDIVAYAAQRHITVVPEIEMPGHSLAAICSYPELACTAESAKLFTAEVGMPFPNVFCAGKEASFKFLETVLDEMMAIFPSKYIHVGGDEVFKVLWKNCEFCQKRMEEEGLTDVDELQSYFIRRIEKHLDSMGRILIGWDEILQGGLAPNATVMSWRGTEGGIEAARAGHDVVMSPYSHCYFDFGYDKTPTEHVLMFEPIPEDLNPEEAKHILGGQANLWTEYVPDLATVQRMTLPRLASMAEILWAGKPDLEDFSARLTPYRERLRTMGLSQNGEDELEF
ncbi:MAG TPA: beta-N-acetylhexosaminidase [Fimbriimonadaceae bacterium]|jgi:hexosaminidase